MVRVALRVSILTLMPLALFVCGCNANNAAANSEANQSTTNSTTTTSSTTTNPAVQYEGTVFGGHTPVSGASVQLYAVGANGDGSPALPLLPSPATTDANGNFNIFGAYTCPAGNPLVYLVATGGSPSPGTVNPNLSLIAALGPCSGITASTPIVINELTTVAAVYSLAPFISSPAAIGSGASDAAALASAFTQASQLVDPGTGTTPGTNVPAGTTIPVAQLNTVASVLASCVNSPGGKAGDGSNCGNLFSLTTPPTIPATAPATNTVAALLNLANNPALNTPSIYALLPPNPPFQPIQTVVPSNLGISQASAAPISLSPTSLDFGPWTVGATAPSQTITVTSFSSSTISLNPTLSGPNASSFTIASGGTCGSTLPPQGLCTLQIGFTPPAVGALSAFLVLNTGSSSSPIQVPLSGGGVAVTAGPVTLTPSTLTFSVAGTTQDITVENFGTTPLVISNIVFSSLTSNSPVYQNNGYFSQTNNCGTTLAPQSVCTISVVSTGDFWAPQSYPVTFTATLTVEDNASSGSQSAALTSTNTSTFGGPPVLNFGDSEVGRSQTQNLSVMGGSHYEVATVSAAIGGANPGDFSVIPTSTCTTVGQTCPLNITFDPTAAGARSAKLLIDGTSQYVPLTGNGVGPGPFFDTSPASIMLSNAIPSAPDPYSNSTASAGVTITNYGTTTFSFSGSFTGTNPSSFSVDGSKCVSLAPQASCTATVSSTPATVGNYSATLQIKDANSTLSRSIPLTANTYYWPLSVSPNPLQFATLPLGATSVPQTFVVGDSNQYPLGHPVSVALSAPSNFRLTQGSTCPASTTQTCTFGVAFSPYQTGTIYEVATVTDQVSGDTYPLQLNGIGGSPAISVSASSVTFPARSVGTTSVPLTVTLTSTGTLPLTVSSVAVVGAVNNNFTQSNNCATVAPNSSCSINVTFAPTAAGTQSATIQVLSNASTSPTPISLFGTAN
jgi:hypothetical protein